MGWEQEALLLGWGDESALSSKANPGCILMETGCACPDMFVCLGSTIHHFKHIVRTPAGSTV